jgi:hypothetical protein
MWGLLSRKGVYDKSNAELIDKKLKAIPVTGRGGP